MADVEAAADDASDRPSGSDKRRMKTSNVVADKALLNKIQEDGLTIYDASDTAQQRGHIIFSLHDLEIGRTYRTENNTSLIRISEIAVLLGDGRHPSNTIRISGTVGRQRSLTESRQAHEAAFLELTDPFEATGGSVPEVQATHASAEAAFAALFETDPAGGVLLTEAGSNKGRVAFGLGELPPNVTFRTENGDTICRMSSGVVVINGEMYNSATPSPAAPTTAARRLGASRSTFDLGHFRVPALPARPAPRTLAARSMSMSERHPRDKRRVDFAAFGMENLNLMDTNATLGADVFL